MKHTPTPNYKEVAPTDHYYDSHLFKSLKMNLNGIKGKAIFAYRCIQCGLIKLTNKNNLKSEYLQENKTHLTQPRCLYNPKQDDELRKFNQLIPRVLEELTLEELIKD